jgi:plastocyanin
VIALVLVAVATAGCGSDEKSSAPPVSLSGTTNNHGSKTASATMEVELDDFYFGPTFIKATEGQRITIDLKNEGKSAHTFTTTELGSVDEELAPGATGTITVTAPASGSGLFFCRFHRRSGMQGAVFVG